MFHALQCVGVVLGVVLLASILFQSSDKFDVLPTAMCAAWCGALPPFYRAFQIAHRCDVGQ